MQDVSAKWAPALATDHGLSVKINVLYDGAVIAEDVAFADGSVRVDRDSETRRSLSLSIADPSAWPASPTDTWNVYGQQIYVERGITYLDGTSERVPLGTFAITSVSGNIHTGPLAISAAGLEILLKRAVWDTATSTASFDSAADFIATVIADTVPGAGFVDESTSGEDPLATKTWDANSDKWAALAECATATGAELFCNANGTFILADIPDPDDVDADPVWTVSAGEGGVMVSADMERSSDGVYNRVIVTGENAEDGAEPVWAEARITDPDDPLVYGGAFGQVTKPYSSSLVTSEVGAQGTANALLRRYRAPNRTVSLESVPNPALDAGDRIRVVYGAAHLPELHTVQSFDVPLSVDGGFTIATISGKSED